VAPAQHELAPIFDTTNKAIDYNLLTMEIMKKVAEKHGLVCLQHEKPFDGVNGSGKHNNWSMSAPGMNLLDPGETPKENLQFLIFLAAVIKAVDEYQDLLRATVATPGNDHRLGAQEAPPAIISIFVGEELADVIEAITADDDSYTSAPKIKMDLGVDVLPKFAKDTTDRNRTSPFAFTGNKFEFRMPGSSQNLSDANTVLNTAVAKELKGYADELEQAEDFDAAVIALVKRTIHDHKRVIFNGNGYSEEWEQEAAKRGLYNLKSTVDALPVVLAEKNVKLMNDFGVMSPVEMRARYEVDLEHYSKIMHIEGRTMLGIARRQLIPAAVAFQADIAAAASAKVAVSDKISIATELDILGSVSKDTDTMNAAANKLEELMDRVETIEDGMEAAHCYHDEIIPAMNELRAAADHAEIICGEDYWPLPTYAQMLFYVE
jgi:glutamine synthetase